MWFLCTVALVTPVSLAWGEDLPARLIVHMTFGSAVTDLETPRPAASPPECDPKLGPFPPRMVTVVGTTGEGYTRFCIGATAAGLEIPFQAHARHNIDFDIPSTVSCVTLGRSESGDKRAEDLRVEVKVALKDQHFPIECDLDRSFLYALSIERQSPTKPNLRPIPGARVWQATIEIPWSVLQLRARESHLQVAFKPGETAKPTLVPLDVTIEDQYGALALTYSPFMHFETPAPSPKKPAARLRDIEADVLYGPDRHTMLAAAFDQNDAAANVQRTSSQIVANAPLPLPSGALGLGTLDNIISRTQPLVAFLRPSTVLGDQDLRVFVDSSPFALSKVGSLTSGYTVGYASPIVGADAFYGLQRSGLYSEAYSLTITVPTPSPRITPSPTPTPSATPTPVPTPVKFGVAPPPLSRPGPIEESKTLHDPLATISLLDSIVGNGSALDNVAGLAFGTNFYRDLCASESVYCALTFHMFGSEQRDAFPRVSSPATVVPPYANWTRFAGESGSYTQTLSANGSDPQFFQVGETFGAQQADRFFAPAAGSVTAFAPLSGSTEHVVFSYGTGPHEHVYSADLLAVRLTSPYGDVFTNVGEQVVIPFDIGSLRNWTFNAGVQSESLSDRVAQLQQGLVTSYFAAVFPSASALTKPVHAAFVRPQSQQNAAVTSPTLKLPWDLTLQLTGGFQNGSVTACAPAPILIVCSTAHDHVGTWAAFINRQPIGFGIANTASAAIPGDLAAGTTSRYFGSYINAPGSITSYLSFSKCVGSKSFNLSAAYTNAGYPSGVPLPQQGSTVSAKAVYPFALPFGTIGVESGYFRSSDFQKTSLNQSGYYGLVRFSTTFRRPLPEPGCSGGEANNRLSNSGKPSLRSSRRWPSIASSRTGSERQTLDRPQSRPAGQVRR